MIARIPSVVVALWLFFAPVALGYTPELLARSDRAVAAVAASSAVLALSPVGRVLRLVHLPLALWLLIAPYALGHSGAGRWAGPLTAVFMAVFALPRGRVAGRYGGGWLALRRGTQSESAPGTHAL